MHAGLYDGTTSTPFPEAGLDRLAGEAVLGTACKIRAGHAWTRSRQPLGELFVRCILLSYSNNQSNLKSISSRASCFVYLIHTSTPLCPCISCSGVIETNEEGVGKEGPYISPDSPGRGRQITNQRSHHCVVRKGKDGEGKGYKNRWIQRRRGRGRANERITTSSRVQRHLRIESTKLKKKKNKG
jgi:hypothetical protein